MKKKQLTHMEVTKLIAKKTAPYDYKETAKKLDAIAMKSLEEFLEGKYKKD